MAYKLELPPQMRIHPVFHVSLLHPYCANTIPGRTQPPPPPIVIEGQEEYEVEEILDSRKRNGRLEYYIDWVGHPSSARSWKPVAHLTHAPEAVARFHARYPYRPGVETAGRPRRDQR